MAFSLSIIGVLVVIRLCLLPFLLSVVGWFMLLCDLFIAGKSSPVLFHVRNRPALLLRLVVERLRENALTLVADSVKPVAKQGAMGYAQFLGQTEHIRQANSKITQTQRHGNQAQIPEQTGRNDQ